MYVMCVHMYVHTYVIRTYVCGVIGIPLYSVACCVCAASLDVVVAAAVASVAAAVVANFVPDMRTIPIIHLMMKKRRH